MSWVELQITTLAEHAVRIEEQLNSFGADAVTFHDGGNQPLYEPSADTPRIWNATIVTGLFKKERLTAPILNYFENQRHAGFLQEMYVKEVPDTDWIRVSMDSFQPMCFGKRLWVCPSWHVPPDPKAANVILDPGLAFGTGSHPTTALCLEWLDQNIKTGTVIDYGCGSGILGIAALKLGAERVFAIDHDPQALASASNNAERNNIQPTDFIVLSSRENTPLPVDLVIANILAKPLIDLSSELATLTKMGGSLVLSGILDSQVESIIEAYEPWYTMQQLVFKEEWALLVGIRANNN